MYLIGARNTNTGLVADRKVRRQGLKYVVLDNTLYRRTIDGLLLKYLGSDQSNIAMGEVHKGSQDEMAASSCRVILADHAK
jgi:hypothetical protein